MTAGTPVRTEPAAGRGLHRQFGWLLASRLIGALLQVVTLGLLARLAGGGDFGRVSAFLGIALALSAAGDFGVGAYLTSVRAAHPDSSQIADALRLNAVSAWLVTALLGAGLTAAGVWGNGVYLAMVPLAAWTGCERLTEARLSRCRSWCAASPDL
jgi:O-antigen/teichoic acid export membrane protein